MSLQYNILWVDDRKEEYEKMEFPKRIEKYLEEHFFIPKIYLCETIEEAENFLKNQRYDIIFSDYNIDEDDITGEDFIKKIREHSVNTEVLFYSAQKDLPNRKIDRVSYLNINSKDNYYSELENKMKFLINLTVEKLNDLNNLRGLVMAEVSELDNIMDKIITIYFNNKDKISEIKPIINEREKSLKKKLYKKEGCENNCYLKIKNDESSIDDILREFDSAFKARTINRIIVKIDYDYKPTSNNFYQDYENDIIKTRNNLAHCISYFEKGKEILKTKYCDEVFDKDKINKIRNYIRNYNTLFNDILNNVSQ